MNKEMITIAVITFFAVVGVHILNISPETQDDFSEHNTSTLNKERVFEDPPETIFTELNIENTVLEYLKKNIAISSFGDEIFCSFEVIGYDMDNGKLNAYLWVLCSELYVSNGKIKEGAGVSEPVLIVCREDEGGYEVVKHVVPMDGAGYVESVANMFPPEYVKKVLPGLLGIKKSDERVAKLTAWNYKQAGVFYGLE